MKALAASPAEVERKRRRESVLDFILRLGWMRVAENAGGKEMLRKVATFIPKLNDGRNR